MGTSDEASTRCGADAARSEEVPAAQAEAGERGGVGKSALPQGEQKAPVHEDPPEEAGELVDEVVETEYEKTPGGHRVTRRVVRRTRRTESTHEDGEETVTEDLPPAAFEAPPFAAHPPPVG